jgi:hypothetical protein
VTAIHTARSVVRHRGVSVLDLHRELGEQASQIRILRARTQLVTALEARLDEQAKTIHARDLAVGDLRMRFDSATRNWDTVNAKAARFDEAEARAKAASEQLAAMQAELQALRAFKANATAIDPLPQHVSTQPTPAVTPLHQSPMAAVTTPGQAPVTWGREPETDAEATQQLPKVVAP